MAWVAAFCFLLLSLVSTSGLEAFRVAWTPLDAGDRLVRFHSQRSFLGQRIGMSPAQYFHLRERSKAFDEIAAYSNRWFWVKFPAGQQSRLSVSIITPSLVSLLRLRFPPGAVVAEEYLRSHPEVLGRDIQVGGTWYRVNGVAPRLLRLAPLRSDFWLIVDDDTFRQQRHNLQLVGRLAPGVSRATAEQEVCQIAVANPHLFGRGIRQVLPPFQHGLASVISPIAITLGALLLLLAALSLHGVLRGGAVRYESYFFSRTALILGGLAAWTGRLVSNQASFYSMFFTLWVAAIVAVLVIWASWRDQQFRCRVCVARMTHPVRIGTHANPLLEGIGSELLCENGHGTLWVPETEIQTFGPKAWRQAA